MPGTTRYSATFDRTYEEEDRINPPNATNARRSRSQSWQANSGHDGRPYTPFGSRLPAQRSSSTDNGPAKGAEHIPTRTAKTDVKAHNNPFQFVKVGTCPLYKKAEEQLKKVKEVKKTDILKEEEEEWQSNLDSWKSRRRKMSEDVFRRQEEIKQLELEEKIAQANQKKTKTFSEMVESRATRGRALSLCLVSSPLEFQNWEFENKTHKNGSCSFTDDSGENSTVNSEDEGVIIRGRLGKFSQSESEINHRTNGDAHIGQNGSKLDAQNGDYNKLSDNVQMKPKENQYIDSGLESISSSHRAGDTPDSGSDFSQDSNSSIDCDSPRTGVNVLEEFNSKASQLSQGHEVTVNLNLEEKGQDFGFTFLGGKDEGQVLIASVLEGSKADSSGIHLGDRIITVDGSEVSSKKHIEIAAMLQKAREKGQIKMVLWRHTTSSERTNGFSTEENSAKPNNTTDSGIKSYEKSIESENEMYVDDFEELQRQSELLASGQKPETTCSNDQAQTKENLPSPSVKDVLPLKTSLVLNLKENISNGADEGTNKNQPKVNAEVNSENQKKNIVKVKRVRRKGVCALNADPNEIPQQGISVSSLFPLSPVTELPSPSEDTKTISSSLTSNNNLATPENAASAKEKVNDAVPQPSSPAVQENKKIGATTIPLTTSSKVSIPPTESKFSDKTVSKTLENLETKSEPASIPASPTAANNKEKKVSLEGSQNEKPKPPKKLKLKVKKGNASEKNSSSPNIIEPSSSPATDISLTNSEKTQTDPKSPLIDKVVKTANEVDSELTSKTREADVILSNTNSLLPTTEIAATENKIPVTATPKSCDTSNEAVKLNMKASDKNISPSRNTKQSKASTSSPESDRPKPILKKVKSKSKEKDNLSAESMAVNTESISTENKNLDTSSASTKKEKSPARTDLKKESSNALPSSPPVNDKPPKTPESEKAKPVLEPNKSNEKQDLNNPSFKLGTPESEKPKPILKKAKSKSKERDNLPAESMVVNTESISKENQNLDASSASTKKEKSPARTNLKKESSNAPASSPPLIAKPPKTPEGEKAKPVLEPNKSNEKQEVNNPSFKPGTPESEKPKPILKKAKSKSKERDNLPAENMVVNTESISTENKNLDASSASTKKEKSPARTNLKKESSNATASSPPLIAKPPKTPESEKAKPVLEPNKSNEKQEVNNQSFKPGTPESEKPKPILKKAKSKSKERDTLPAESMAVNTESVATENKNLDTSSTGNKKEKSPVITDLKKESSNAPPSSPSLIAKPPKTPESEKAKPVLEPSKANEKQEISPDFSSVGKNISVSSNSSASASSKTIVKEDMSKKELKPSSASQTKQANTVSKNKTVPSLPKENKKEQISESTPSAKDISVSSDSNTSGSSKITAKENVSKKEQKSSSVSQNKPSNTVSKNGTILSYPMENDSSPTGNTSSALVVKPVSAKAKIPASSVSQDKSKKLSLKIDVKKESVNSSSPPVKTPQTPTTPKSGSSDPVFSQKKQNTKSKEKVKSVTNVDKTESQKSPSATSPLCNSISSDSSVTSNKDIESSDKPTTENSVLKSPVNTQDGKLKLPTSTKRTRNRTKKKNANSQKTNIPAKQNEELLNANDSLNIVFQSQPKNVYSDSQHNNVNPSETSCSVNVLSTDLVPDVPPVEKVAEEMEKLILEQLEEEERAKELSSKGLASPEHLLTAPPRLAEPPKEKPPPPPSVNEGNQKESSLKRVNSTKRIKKEIHKRRSNFLGIDSADENIASSESSIPPPPALEEILKAEMELDRQSRLKIESAATERLTLEEKEIMRKEKEIIESLESEERQKQLINGIGDCQDVVPNTTEDVSEENRIESLKSERRRIETERQLSEEKQQIQLLEEKQLREREDFLRKQEAVKPTESFSDTSLSVAENVTNALKKPELSASLPTETQSNALLLGSNGDGKSFSSNTCEISENKTDDEKKKASQKPAVPPKPLKKKEAIRKERERLRQEQEALQREREEHRRKLMQEQEELMKHQKSHAPDVPVPRLGTLPPIVQPTFPPQLTTTPHARESASFPSRSHHGAPNGAVGNMNTVELMGPPVVRQNRLPAPRKAVQNEPWGQQKMPSVRKQNHDSLPESRYNQNHWLIQEAEMRRITELKERQQRTTTQLLPSSQTHLAEDDVCSSNPPRVPVIPPPQHNPHLNYAAQEKMWNYGQSANLPLKKYPPPVVKEPPLHTIYPPRETVSQQPPTKPSRVVPMDRQEQMLSVSGRKRCSHCNEELGRGAAMIIESLHLYYHIHCFQCCVCQAQLGNGSCGTDVRVRNSKLHCHSCYSNDEAGLKFSQV